MSETEFMVDAGARLTGSGCLHGKAAVFHDGDHIGEAATGHHLIQDSTDWTEAGWQRRSSIPSPRSRA
jgi:hypothetical protein